MKYSKRRSYRDEIVVEVETVVKKTAKKKKEDGLIKSLFKKLTKN
jgi:hypothetical protein